MKGKYTLIEMDTSDDAENDAVEKKVYFSIFLSVHYHSCNYMIVLQCILVTLDLVCNKLFD